MYKRYLPYQTRVLTWSITICGPNNEMQFFLFYLHFWYHISNATLVYRNSLSWEISCCWSNCDIIDIKDFDMNWLYLARTRGGLIRHFFLNCISCYLDIFNLFSCLHSHWYHSNHWKTSLYFPWHSWYPFSFQLNNLYWLVQRISKKRKILQKSLHVSLSIVCPAAILLSLHVREKFEASDQNIVIYEQYTLSTISESNRFFVFIIF